MKTGAGVETFSIMPSSSIAASSRSRPERGPDARQFLRGEQLGQIVVPPARADAADAGQGVQKRLEDRAGVVVQSAGDRHDRAARRSAGTPAAATPSSTSLQLRHAGLAGLAAGHQRLDLPQHLVVAAGDFRRAAAPAGPAPAWRRPRRPSPRPRPRGRSCRACPTRGARPSRDRPGRAAPAGRSAPCGCSAGS